VTRLGLLQASEWSASFFSFHKNSAIDFLALQWQDIGEHTKSISGIASAQYTELDIIVEGRILAETSGVGHSTCCVVEVVFEAGNLRDDDVSLGSFLCLATRGVPRGLDVRRTEGDP
jgi:hypothetical protein